MDVCYYYLLPQVCPGSPNFFNRPAVYDINVGTRIFVTSNIISTYSKLGR